MQVRLEDQQTVQGGPDKIGDVRWLEYQHVEFLKESMMQS